MNVLITGGNGYIGQQLNNAFQKKFNITLLTRQIVDLTDSVAVSNFFKDKFYDVVIHAAVTGGSRLKKDDYTVLDNNLLMYYNLLKENKHYTKFINLTSGAEIYAENTPYGLSKSVISKSINDKPNFYNLRIYAVFNEHEKDTRFIKANILKYIKKEPMMVHENKLMDFFYMNDFYKLVNFYITSLNPPKSIDCTYQKTFSLLQIANLINTLDTYKVEININCENTSKYSGVYTPLIEYDGLEIGIKNTFNYLKNSIYLL